MLLYNLRFVNFINEHDDDDDDDVAGPPGPRVSQMLSPREKLHPREIYASGGGLLVALINAPRLLSDDEACKLTSAMTRHVPVSTMSVECKCRRLEW